ncbi:MAG: hypothetical protein Salg2KO_19600 [Salibacteraceae bacterium]
MVLVGCETVDKDGFSPLQDAIRYKRVTIGDEESPVSNADVLSIEVKVSDEEGILAAKSYRRISKTESRFPSYFNELLADSWQGDSLVIRGPIDALLLDKWFHSTILETTGPIILEVFVKEAMSDSALRQTMANERLKIDLELKESSNLSRILDSLGMRNNELGGIYFKPVRYGAGVIPADGDFVKTHYTMQLSNGDELVNTYESEPFEYQVGKPDQAIPGFALAVRSMRVGGEYLAIIPSNMGFGEKGSSSGLVPPYSVLICKIELLSAE